jgi:hypothetical protein
MKTTIFLGRKINVFFLSLSFSLIGLSTINAQGVERYFLEIKEGYELGNVTKTVN